MLQIGIVEKIANHLRLRILLPNKNNSNNQ